MEGKVVFVPKHESMSTYGAREDIASHTLRQ